MPDITSLFEGADGVSRTLFNQKIGDINAHGNDETRHVTEKERARWNGKANGNNAVWYATDVYVGTGDPNDSMWLTIPNFVFTEGCQVTFKAIKTPKPNNPYFCVNCGGIWYPVRNSKGELLDEDAWVIGANVTVTLTEQSFNHPKGWPTAFFKSGSGSVKEMYSFPLSIQTAEPTPVNINHIWIMNDTKMELVLDEAIRANDWGGDNRYYALVDSTDNNYILQGAPMKTTDGVPITFINRHINKDTCPWTLGRDVIYAKKYGINYYNDCYSKWPRIMSRINGVIDVENAKRWDGSSWQWLSQKGHYLLSANSIMYRKDAELSNARLLRGDNSVMKNMRVAATLDGNYFASTRLGVLYIYKRDGDSFSIVNTINSSNASIMYWTAISFSPDGQYLAALCNRYDTNIFNNSNGLYIYKKNSSGIWSELQNNSLDTTIYGVQYYGICWDEYGDKLFTSYTNYTDNNVYNNALRISVFTKSNGYFVRTINKIYSEIIARPFTPIGMAIHGNNLLLNVYLAGNGVGSKIYLINDLGVADYLFYDTSALSYDRIAAPLCIKYIGNNVFAWITTSDSLYSALKLYNVVTKKYVIATVQSGTYYINGLTLSPDGKYLFCNIGTNLVKAYSINTDGETPSITSLYSTNIPDIIASEIVCL